MQKTTKINPNENRYYFTWGSISWLVKIFEIFYRIVRFSGRCYWGLKIEMLNMPSKMASSSLKTFFAVSLDVCKVSTKVFSVSDLMALKCGLYECILFEMESLATIWCIPKRYAYFVYKSFSGPVCKGVRPENWVLSIGTALYTSQRKVHER